MKKLIIDRNIWIRGTSEGKYKNGETSMLLTHNGSRCCIGIHLSQCGLSDNLLQGRCYAEDSEVKLQIPDNAKWLLENIYGGRSELADTLYGVNDDSKITEEHREKEIIRLFAEADIEVEFIN